MVKFSQYLHFILKSFCFFLIHLFFFDDFNCSQVVARFAHAFTDFTESALAQETANLIPICKDDFGSSIKLFGIFEPVSVSGKYRMPRTGKEGTPDQDEKDDAREKCQNAQGG